MNDRSAFTISEFCERHGFSRGFFYKMKKRGIAPRELVINGLIRITVESESQWKAEREAATAAEQTAAAAA
jgi:predicted DNA-binding transcriptional regulator AlpA